MRLAIGGDSAGAPLVRALAEHLGGREGLEVVDLSQPPGDASGDGPGDASGDGAAELYPDLAGRVGDAVMAGRFDRAILCCGTGIGVCISANKVPGIRAALTHDAYSAERAALSNNAQVITMGARVIGPELAKTIADAWLAKTEAFDPEGRSAANVAAIDALDARRRG